MGTALLNYKEKVLNLEKKEKKSNLNSFYFFLVFIIMYISTFYIFNLSPSTLMRTTKFWFLMSNTLILIIAADSGAFSPSKTLQDYTKINLPPTPPPCSNFPTKYVPKTTPQDDSFDQTPEKIIEVVVVVAASDDDDNIVLTQETLEVEKHTGGKDDDDDDDDDDGGGGDDEKESEIERVEEEALCESEREEDEYSRMSDEEVNERVEEFIRRFNRQIRLQAVTSRRSLP